MYSPTLSFIPSFLVFNDSKKLDIVRKTIDNMQFNQTKLNLIVLIAVSVIAVIAVGGDIGASFSVVFKKKPVHGALSFACFALTSNINATKITVTNAPIKVERKTLRYC